MAMKVREGTSQGDIDLFCKRASRVTLSQLVENVIVRETSKAEGQARRTVFSIDINFFPEDEYTVEYDVEPTEILNVFSIRFPLMLKREIASEMKKLDADLKSQISELGKGKRRSEREVGDDADEDEDGEEAPKKKRADDEESEVGDGDADDDKRTRQKKEQATYESDEDEDEDEPEGEFDDTEIEAAYAGDEDSMDVDSVEKKKKRKLSSLEEETERVGDMFTQHLLHATSFSFTPSQCNFVLEVGILPGGFKLKD